MCMRKTSRIVSLVFVIARVRSGEAASRLPPMKRAGVNARVLPLAPDVGGRMAVKLRHFSLHGQTLASLAFWRITISRPTLLMFYPANSEPSLCLRHPSPEQTASISLYVAILQQIVARRTLVSKRTLGARRCKIATRLREMEDLACSIAPSSEMRSVVVPIMLERPWCLRRSMLPT